jgi:hypothetical protein
LKKKESGLIGALTLVNNNENQFLIGGSFSDIIIYQILTDNKSEEEKFKLNVIK